MTTTPKLTKQPNINTTYWSLHMTGQHAAKCHQDDNKQALHNDPQRNLDNYSEKAEERPDRRNSIATDRLATKLAPWRVKYNRKLRKTNVFMNGIPLIANILPLTLCLCYTMPGPYKGFLTQCTTKQEHAKPRHQPSDRDQRARDRLRNKASAFQAKIKSPAYIAFGAAALHTVYQNFDPDFPISFHLSTLATETAANTIPTIYVVQKDRHCMPTSDYYFTNIQLDSIIIPPHRGNNSSSTPQQAAAKDPIPQQTDTLKPGETRVYPSMLAEKQVPVLDLTNSTIT